MANCPKCGEHLRMADWKQHCPHCKCNIVLYDIQERLMQDADKAEVQYYYFQKKIDRMKASFVGSKLAVARIFTSFLPLAAIVVPWLSGWFKAPFVEFEGVYTLFNLMDMLETFDINGVAGLLSTGDGKTPMILLLSAVALLVLSLVLVLVHFGCITMACGKKAKARCYGFNISMLALSVVATILLMCIPDNPYFGIAFPIAPFVYILLLAVNFAIEIAIYKKGVEVKHAQCFVGGIPIEEYFKMVEDGVPQDEIRQEMYRRLTEMQLEKEKALNGEEKKYE